MGQPSRHRSSSQLWTPTLVLREGGASSETGHFLPMVLVKCCHANGSRVIDGLNDTARVTALRAIQLANTQVERADADVSV